MMRKTALQRFTIGLVATAIGVGSILGTAVSASALSQKVNGGYTGHSFYVNGNNSEPPLRVQTLYQNTSANLRVCAQGESAGSPISSIARVCGSTNSFAQWTGGAQTSYYIPGGRHWKADGSYFSS